MNKVEEKVIRTFFEQHWEETQAAEIDWFRNRPKTVRLNVISEAILKIVQASEWADSNTQEFGTKQILKILHDMKGAKPMESHELNKPEVE